MIKYIAILGSTGSIGKSLIKLVKESNNKIQIKLLSCNTNYKLLLNQAKFFNVKNLIIKDLKTYIFVKKKFKHKNLNIYNNYNCFKKIFGKRKLDYVMSSISGLDGLEPTINIIKHTKKIGIANKESLICAWNLILEQIKKNHTQFIPVDSEHFSIWYSLLDNDLKISQIIITASGGPFRKYPKKKLKYVTINQALKHPNWKMGKKITIDSATLMNKVFEILEAKNIFNLTFDKLSIMIHKQSYIHSIIKYHNGIIKIIAHDTTMTIPIYNSLGFDFIESPKTKNINYKFLNSLTFEKIDYKKFPINNILKKIPNKNSLFETVIVSCNDALVNLFLCKKIKFLDIYKNLNKLLNLNEFKKFKKIKPKKIDDIINLNKLIRFKIKNMYL